MTTSFSYRHSRQGERRRQNLGQIMAITVSNGEDKQRFALRMAAGLAQEAGR
jgi:hypothetical protein